jgi:predicted nucleic acid-binding protein
MRNGLVIADSGPILSLALVDKLSVLDQLFDDIRISKAVWEEISNDDTKPYHDRIVRYFKDKVETIKGYNNLTFIMDYGESESVILYKELNANFLLIDDKKARNIAENFNINCVGTLGILIKSKELGLVDNLKPIFKSFLNNKRYYSTELLNRILIENNENPI